MNSFRTICVLGFFLLLFPILGTAQSYQAPKKSEPKEVPYQNAFFVELMGNGGAYSLNYERLFLLAPPVSIYGRTGVSFFGGRFSFPILLELSHSFIAPFEMESGAGAALVPDLQKGGVHHEWTASGGLRYTNQNGFIFRLTYTPFFRPDGEGARVKHWGGVSAGLLF